MPVCHKNKLIFSDRKFKVCLFTKDDIDHISKGIPHKNTVLCCFACVNLSKNVNVNIILSMLSFGVQC